MKKSPPRPTAGFTLIELLAVMTIIGILLALGMSFMRYLGGAGVSTGVAQAEAFFAEGRAVAIGSGRATRVLIDVEDAESESYLRRMLIALPQLDATGNPVVDAGGVTQWELVGGVFTLPQGIFFSQDFSRKDHNSGLGEIDPMELAGVTPDFVGTYRYYEFNAEGVCTTGIGLGGAYAPPSFIVGRGMRDPGAAPRVTSDGRLDFGGFVIWRNGSTAVFRNPQQILGATEPTTF